MKRSGQEQGEGDAHALARSVHRTTDGSSPESIARSPCTILTSMLAYLERGRLDPQHVILQPIQSDTEETTKSLSEKWQVWPCSMHVMPVRPAMNSVRVRRSNSPKKSRFEVNNRMSDELPESSGIRSSQNRLRLLPPKSKNRALRPHFGKNHVSAV